MSRLICRLLAAVALWAPGVQAGDLLVNGSFKKFARVGSLAEGRTDLPGWTVTGKVRIEQAGGKTQLTLDPDGSVEQTFDTQAGAEYGLNVSCASQCPDLRITFVGATSNVTFFPDPGPLSVYAPFTADQDRTTVQIATGGDKSVAIDDITVSLRSAAGASLAGEWVDSQSNRVHISESDRSIRILSPGWRFVSGSGEIHEDLDLRGGRSGNDLKLQKETARGLFTMTAVLAHGELLASLTIPRTEELGFVMRRVPPAGHEPKISALKATRVVLNLEQTSTTLGKWISGYVYLGDPARVLTLPEVPTMVVLNSEGGKPVPAMARLTREFPRASVGFKLQSDNVNIEAQSQGFESSKAIAHSCYSTPVAHIELSQTDYEGDADGQEKLRFTLLFRDAQNKMSNNEESLKIPAWTQHGTVSKVRDPEPRDCEQFYTVSSSSPGKIPVSASLGALTSKELEFRFHAVLGEVKILLALLGAILGGVASALHNFASSQRWKWKRWAAWAIVSSVAGLALYLCYHYWPVEQGWVRDADGLAFLLGLLGGFGGAKVLARLSREATGAIQFAPAAGAENGQPADSPKGEPKLP